MNAIDVFLSPPLAFVIYLGLAGALAMLGRLMSKSVTRRNLTADVSGDLESTLYGGGEVHPTGNAVPGYRSFFTTALFFAVLHLGALMLVSSSGSSMAVLYIVGLGLALLVLQRA